MVPAVFARLIILSLGFLYPAFNSYKAIRDKNTREYVKWMMYWVVFALFCVAEAFADVFVAFWCPFYQELKILTVIWFLAPATRGSSYLYRNFVHPFFNERAHEIDIYLGRVHRQGIVLIVSLSSRVVAQLSATLAEALLKVAPQLAFGAVQTRPRSVLTSSAQGRSLPAEPEAHGDEGDSRQQLISELSDDEPPPSAPVAVAKTQQRRRQQNARKPPQIQIQRDVSPAVTDDEEQMDEDLIELARSNSFEREFFPREMLPSPSEENIPAFVASRTASKKKVPAAKVMPGGTKRRPPKLRQQ
ncbi:unnamed protein product [Notodromas monacha]|uniref:Receptor expression-enhancing protein n=1 Tax=Notodromas monacha TaxID=399045 RepID=A0A7R9BIM5_9CRUS|nr:unnamed protein product [Notodromas monacha]CAG0914808.1 unnamed protein product [Notodromas monacha]